MPADSGNRDFGIRRKRFREPPRRGRDQRRDRPARQSLGRKAPAFPTGRAPDAASIANAPSGGNQRSAPVPIMSADSWIAVNWPAGR